MGYKKRNEAQYVERFAPRKGKARPGGSSSHESERRTTERLNKITSAHRRHQHRSANGDRHASPKVGQDVVVAPTCNQAAHNHCPPEEVSPNGTDPSQNSAGRAAGPVVAGALHRIDY